MFKGVRPIMNSAISRSLRRLVVQLVASCVLPLQVSPALAEEPNRIRPIGFREAVRLAMGESVDVQLARLRVETSTSDLALASADRSLQVHAGSGLGATSGIPQSIQGSAPSVAQVTVRKPLIDLGRARRAEGVREQIRSGELAFDAASEESVYRVGLLYLDFEHSTREVERMNGDLQLYEEIEALTAARVEEGLEASLALSRVRLDTARARERLATAQTQSAMLEAELKSKLGMGQDVQLRPEPGGDDPGSALTEFAETIRPRPVDEHPEIAALGAEIRAARHRAAEARSARLPRMDVVGQYALLARFNNYDDYFRRFQRHNWQAGLAVEIPVFTGRGIAERVAKERLRERELTLRQEARTAAVEVDGLRSRALLKQAERLADLARQELAFARENLSVLLAQFDEGSIGVEELERARIVESAAWGGLIRSRYDLAKALLGSVYTSGRIRSAFAD